MDVGGTSGTTGTTVAMDGKEGAVADAGTDLSDRLDRHGYEDVGGGWYVALDDDWSDSDGNDPVAYLGDSRSTGPDVSYGAAAWGGREGPFSALTLAVVEGVGWAAHRAGESVPFPRRAFPGEVRVTSAGRHVGLGRLDGVIVGTVAELVREVTGLRTAGREGGVLVGDAAGRAAKPHGMGRLREVPESFLVRREASETPRAEGAR